MIPTTIILSYSAEGGDVSPALIERVAAAAVGPLALVQGSSTTTGEQAPKWKGGARLAIRILARAANLPEAQRAARVAAGAIRPLTPGPVRIEGPR